jgi:hypothetical protein
VPPGAADRPVGAWFNSWIVEVGRWVGVVFTSGNVPPDPVSVFCWVPPSGVLTTVGGTSLLDEQPASSSPAASAAAPIPRGDKETVITSAPLPAGHLAERDLLAICDRHSTT